MHAEAPFVGASLHSCRAGAATACGQLAVSTWRRQCRSLAMALLLALPIAPCAHADDAIETLVLAIAVTLDPRVAEVLPHIDGAGGKLLALRSYLRSHDRLAERWSWTQEQIHAFEGSPEHRDLLGEIERVRELFSRDNPGFELWVNPQVRSLDRQI